MPGFPTYDPLGSMTAGTQSGLQIAHAMLANRDQDLRMQELRSQDALRRMTEQHIAQQMQYATEAHDLAIQERADLAKAMARVQLETAPTIDASLIGPPQAGQGDDLGIGQIKNPNQVPFERSMMNNVLPVIGKYRPQEVPAFVQDMAMYPYRQAEAKRQEALAQKALSDIGRPKPFSPVGKLQADRAAAVQAGDEAGVQQIDDAIKKATTAEKNGVDPEVFRVIRMYEERTGKKMSDEDVKNIVDYHLGVKARPGVEHPMTFQQYFSKHIDKAMEQQVVKDSKTGNYRLPRNRDEAREYLKKEYETNFGPEPQTPSPKQDGDMIFMKSTDGKIYKVPSKNAEKAKAKGWTDYEG